MYAQIPTTNASKTKIASKIIDWKNCSCLSNGERKIVNKNMFLLTINQVAFKTWTSNIIFAFPNIYLHMCKETSRYKF